MNRTAMIQRVKAVGTGLCCLLLSALTFGQGGVATGDLHVTVKDPTGNVVINATVTVRDVAKGLERAGTGDGQGGYGVRLLPPGTYTVTVDARGFAKAEAKEVAIPVGGLVELPVALTLATGKEVVEVSAQGELVETSRSSTTDTIGQRRIDNLPINGRNYINFTLTDSQVVHDAAPNLGAAPTSGLNMSGQRARSNLVNVDGTDATDNSVNGVRSTVSQEAVQEFQIITNNYAAEYGRASGGVVNIITRSGSNDFHGDVYGYLRNRNFQAVNPFSTVKDPAYTRVQAGAAFGGALKKDKTYYYFSYEVTRRHETGFSSIGQGNFGLVPFDASPFFGAPAGTFGIQVTPEQAAFLATPGLPLALAQQYSIVTGASSGVAVNRKYPDSFALLVGAPGGLPDPLNQSNPLTQFITTCNTTAPLCNALPTSFQSLASQVGNFPVFEGTSLYSLRLDHNLTSANRLMLRANVSPSTVTGIEVSGQDQPFGQNAYSRTSQQTYRDVAGSVQDTWTMGNTRINEFRFQYARRGLSYFYNTQIPGGSDPAVNITGLAYFGREPYSYIQRTETRYQFIDNFSWSIGRHNTKFGADFNYLPVQAIFTVNYGGVYDFGSFNLAPFGFPSSAPDLSPVQAYGAGLPASYVQGLGSPRDTFKNIPFGAFWQDSWRVNPNVTLNFGVRYDVEIPPKFKAPQGLALPAYNLLGLQKGIQTDKNNIQPRIGVAWDPKGNGKTVVRASYGLFYDHPLLGLYFLGDASDGSSSGQLAFVGTGLCSGAGQPGNLNGIPIFQGLIPSASGSVASPCSPTQNPAVLAALNYSPDQQRFSCSGPSTTCGANFPQSIFLNQNYLNLSTFMPLGFQPFGYPQAKNFVYAYSQQANFSIERDLGGGFALNLAYNFNGGRHLNRPINASTVRGDLLTANFEAAYYDALLAGQTPPASPFIVSGCNPPGGPAGPFPYVDAAMMNFFRPGGLNPSIAAGRYLAGDANCVMQGIDALRALPGFNAGCNPAPPTFDFTSCIPFGDMDANYSNGSSVYHGFTANLRKRFSNHYEFLASYTWSHAIDDSTDLQSTLTPQDSYFPAVDRSSSLFDQRHRFVFSAVYQTGKLGGSGFARKVFSDWTFAPVIEVASGRPFNIVTGNPDNFQLSALTGRPNTTVDPACGPVYKSKFSPTGVLQEPCINGFVAAGTVPTLLQLDGNLGRNAGLTPWTVFDDLRVSKRINFSERMNLDLIADMFNIANKMNVAAVSPLFTIAGQPTAAYDPRQFQFAMKVNW
ncbi:MAG: carboxypeptidase regulatory-like domain-containing protein [Acidobacteriia bacterium]|nr:carboxypeptidase regulatory-like domain-containing protein [Terriglobia bacterium]